MVQNEESNGWMCESNTSSSSFYFIIVLGFFLMIRQLCLETHSTRAIDRAWIQEPNLSVYLQDIYSPF